MRELELRNHSGAVEFRASDKGNVLAGYASVFNRNSQNLGGFVERVDPAAFNKSLADGVPVFARYNHEDNFLLGTTEAETLRLSVDGTGLHYEVDLPDTTAGRDVSALASRGDLRYSSFAFRTLDDEWDFTPEGFPLRTLLGVQLVDVAPVVNPAYRDTTTGLRSFAEHFELDLEQVKREAQKGGTCLRSLVESSRSLRLPAVGDRVVIDPDSRHDPAHATGTIAEVGTSAYGVVMDAMPDMGVHRWYTANEFDFEDDAASGDGERKKKKKPAMGGMQMNSKDSGAHGDGSDTGGQVANHPLLSIYQRKLQMLAWE